MKINFPGTTDTSYGTDSLVNQFIQYNQWTDSNAPNSYQKGCSSNSKDFWSTDLTTCKSGYVKVAGGAAANGDPNCLLFSEWSAQQTTVRYSSRPAGCSTTTGSPDFTSVPAATSAYFNGFSSYSTSNTNLINQLKVETNSLNSGFTSMAGKLLTMLNNINGILEPLVKIFKDFVGDSGLFQLVNCSKFDKFF